MEKVKQNGLLTTSLPVAEKNKLSTAQQKHLQRLVILLGRAELAHKAAQEAMELAQGNANEFVAYCAEEQGITLGLDGWRFDQGTLCFMREEEVRSLEATVPNGND